MPMVMRSLVYKLGLLRLNCSHLILNEVIYLCSRSLSQGDRLLSHCKGWLREATTLLAEAAKIRFRTDFQVSNTTKWFASTKAAVMLHEKVKSEIQLLKTEIKLIEPADVRVGGHVMHLLSHLVALLPEI